MKFPGINSAIMDHLKILTGIEVPSQDAIYSAHDIARHWLALEDFTIRDGYEGLEINHDCLPEPKTPYVPPVLTVEEQRRRDHFANLSSVSYPVSRMPMRVKL